MFRKGRLQMMEELLQTVPIPCKTLNIQIGDYVDKYGDDKDIQRIGAMYYEYLSGISVGATCNDKAKFKGDKDERN